MPSTLATTDTRYRMIPPSGPRFTGEACGYGQCTSRHIHTQGERAGEGGGEEGPTQSAVTRRTRTTPRWGDRPCFSREGVLE